MNVLDSMRVATRALNANKMRSSLTMLGVIIGVAAVIALLSIGQGVQTMVTEQIQGLGSNLLFVVPGEMGEGPGEGFANDGNNSASSLTYDDAEAIADSRYVPDAAMVAPVMSGGAQVSYRSQEMAGTVSGVSSDHDVVRSLEVAYGRFLSIQDVDTRSRVAVLGWGATEELFEGVYPIEQSIKINNVPFRVIGVLEEKGGTGFGSSDDYIYVPITTAQTRLFSQQRNLAGEFEVSTIYVQVVADDRMDAATEQVNQVLRRTHDISLGEDDDFTVINQGDLVDMMAEVTGILTLFLGAIAAISLLVGGIGIMNIMLVSVTERTREIGIRKAVGAKRRHILLQFLTEAMVLSLVGGALGMLVGFVLSQGISNLMDMTTVVSANSVLLATTFSLVVGVVFGLYPAVRASRLNPIEALRYE